MEANHFSCDVGGDQCLFLYSFYSGIHIHSAVSLPITPCSADFIYLNPLIIINITKYVTTEC